MDPLTPVLGLHRAGAPGSNALSTLFLLPTSSMDASLPRTQMRVRREWMFHDPAFVERILIHEEQHSVGLGQNPPSSFEINGQIARRCGRRSGCGASIGLRHRLTRVDNPHALRAQNVRISK